MNEFITKEVKDNGLILHINGPLDGISAPYLTLDNISPDESINHIVLECHQATFMDSAGIAAIVGLFKNLEQQNIKLSIASLSAQPKTLIETLQLGEAIAIFDTVEEASL